MEVALGRPEAVVLGLVGLALFAQAILAFAAT